MIQYSKQAIKFLNFPKKSWDNIAEIPPDKWDMEMLHEAVINQDCKEFVSSDIAMKELGLT